jgi:hypothetical protein
MQVNLFHLFIHSLVGALAKNGSFGFSVFGCVSAKTKCAICGSAVFLH